MGTVTTIVLVVLLAILAAGVIFAVALARRSRAQLTATPAPGLAGGAPREWAGQHTPEAKMHRRLAGLATTLAALPLGDAPAIERQVELEQRIKEYDRLLVAVALAPESARRDAVAALQPKVDAAEAEIGALATEPPLT